MEEAFPQLEEALIEYRETGDGVFEKHPYIDPTVYTKPHQVREPLMRCSNPRCERGGYEIDREILNMTLSKAVHREFVSALSRRIYESSFRREVRAAWKISQTPPA